MRRGIKPPPIELAYAEERLPAAWRSAIRAILQAALKAADPQQALWRNLRREGDALCLQGSTARWPLHGPGEIYVVALGKAALPMAAALHRQIGDVIRHTLVITKQAEMQLPGAEVLIGDHPLPGEQSLRAGQRLRQFLQSLREQDLLIVLLSGGGSALATLPPAVSGAPLSLEDLRALNQALLSCGADIREINIVRRHLDPLKGGGWLRLTPAATLTLALSDVPGNAPEAIASGPTAPDPTTLADAWGVIERYGLRTRLPPSLLQALTEAPETLKPGELPLDPKTGQPRHVYRILGENRLAAQAARKAAQRHGFHARLLTTTLQGEASQAGRFLAAILKQIAESDEPLPRPACLIAGGETTVTVHGSGRGGRNQELALAAALDLDGVPGVALMALATDGQDGPTEAAGALVTGDTLRRAAALGLEARRFLENQDSYTFFSALGDSILLSKGRTNVNDLIFLFGF
jgi:glycerate 2-kinase